MRILLVNPSTADDLLSSAVLEIPYLDAKAFFAPHAVAAVAALTPREHRVYIHDEQVKGPVEELLDNQQFDVVGISLVATQLKRTVKIARHFRAQRCPGKLVVGGIGTSYMIAQLRELVDTAIFGEAEETWPQYLEDLAGGTEESAYQRATKPDLTKVPEPRWDLIANDMSAYSAVSVQTTRGCHFDCAFCDVIYTYGRRPRSKTIDQIVTEVKTLAGFGARMVFLADDNFGGNRDYAKEVLRELVELNNSFVEPLGFLTQVDITIAEDDELLELMADANMLQVHIGIESANLDSLRDMNKLQNTKLNLVDAVRRIQSYGIVVLAHMIIGADSDDLTAFEETARFVQDANILNHICHPLSAPPGTRLWYRLKREGRIVKVVCGKDGSGDISTKVDVLTNIVPKKMSRVELFRGLAEYWEKISDPGLYVQRAIGFIDGVTRKPRVRAPGLKGLWKIKGMLARMLKFYAVGVPAAQRKAFFTVFRMGSRKKPYLMQRIVFGHTGYLMDHKRALLAARVAHLQAQWEADNPDAVTIVPSDTPLPVAVRGQAKELFTTAYMHVRVQTGDRETLYSTVIEGMRDFADRFGDRFEELDDVFAEHIRESCDRVLARAHTTVPSGDLPLDRPPPGFVREILDGLDRAIRIADYQ